ncbi:hypothetical protein CAP35_13475 [Chitinophagaceae bacterium IBVUCB1]|nr:hypothetical protein CAP35_13475 [Chitinophagaceae bacterium IBVUCB1]
MKYLYKRILIILCAAVPHLATAQSLLNKTVSIDAKSKPVGEVLKTIGKQGGFYFSYNSELIQDDSLVSLSVKNKTVKQVLGILFDKNFEYTETPTHIIIQPSAAMYWYAAGYVKDVVTGEGIPNASVYEKTQFVSTLTNELGYFRLRLKDRNKPAVISVSKSWYIDTAITIQAGAKQEVKVAITPKSFELDSFVVTQKTGVEGNWLSRMFLSSKQRMQGVNLGKFFADKPYQTSLLPGLGTHGRMSGQAVNKFSFNVLGGYAGGVNGFEMAGIFNINKTDVRGVQLAGIFNMAGGRVSGLQVAGVYNHVMKVSEGWQFAGIANLVNDELAGVQIGGAYNHVSGGIEGVQIGGFGNYSKGVIAGVQISGAANYADSTLQGTQITGMGNIATQKLEGVQIAGAFNYAHDTVAGSQVAGFANIAGDEISGTQVSAMFNYAKHVKGVQVGIINIADTSSGVSVGLVNFIVKGYHKVVVSSNEITNLQVAGKLGNRNLYTILAFGVNAGNQRAFTGGYGVGRQFNISKRISLNPELTAHQLYLGDVNYFNGFFRLDVGVHYKINRYISAYAAPAYTICYKDQITTPSGYRNDLPYSGIYSNTHRNFWSSWVGWSFGISIF